MRLILFLFLVTAFSALADQDADFLAARDAFRARDAIKLQKFAQRLKNTPLEVYVSYYQLRMDLDNVDTVAMGKFLSRPEDTPMIDELRGDWLKLLGLKKQWKLFDEEYPRLLKEDVELTCYILQSRLRNNDEAALRDARSLWFNGKGLPESCGIPFETAIYAGLITKQDIEQRLRLSLESGNVSLAKQLAARLDSDQRVPYRDLESASADALRYLDKLKLDAPQPFNKSGYLAKTGSPAVKANTGAAIEVRAATGTMQTPAYRKPVADYSLPVQTPPYADDALLPHYLASFESGRTPRNVLSTRFSASLKAPLGHPILDYANGWPTGFASGCLDFTPILPDITTTNPNRESSAVHVCLNPCGIFTISDFIALQQIGADAGRQYLLMSGLYLGGIDTAAIESMLANIRPNEEKTGALPMGTDPDTRLTSKNGGEIAAEGWPGWNGLLDQIGLGKSGDPAGIKVDGGLSVSLGCESCVTEDEVSTVSPMEWNPKLGSEGQRAVVLFALQRLAKQSLELAAARWMKIAAYFPAPEQHYFYGWLAYEAARDLDGRALQWYKAAANTPLNEQQFAWRVRAALRAQDWPEVLSSINSMSEQQQREAAWRYWKGRALQVMGKTIEARNIFAPLSSELHYYGLLAGEELASVPVLSQTVQTYRPDNQAIAEMMELPGVQRTLALYRMGLRNEALEEWRWLIRNFNDRELITAAEIARRNEMYDRAIGAADRTVNVHDFSLRYLAPYRELLQEHVRDHGLEEAWVYGLMRQESRFVSSAKSNAGAAGLMQIMPATARWVASKLGLKSYRNKLIHDLDTNLRLGTYYMKSILSQFDESPVLATAAYNAGPRRAREWRGDRPMEGAIYAETIPFEETRDYVKKVLSNTVFYASQFNAPLRTLKQRLGIIAGKAEDKLQLEPFVPGEPAEP